MSKIPLTPEARAERQTRLDALREPIDLDSRRDRYEGIMCPECKGVDFTVQSVMLREDYTVQGYVAPLACRDCGHLLMAGR